MKKFYSTLLNPTPAAGEGAKTNGSKEAVPASANGAEAGGDVVMA